MRHHFLRSYMYSSWRRLSLMFYLGEIADQVDDGAERVGKLTGRSGMERVLRKLDMRFLPTNFLVYLVNYIDRIAITAARLKGLEQDLGLSDVQYDMAVAILYATYCIVQIPQNNAKQSRKCNESPDYLTEQISNQMTKRTCYV